MDTLFHITQLTRLEIRQLLTERRKDMVRFAVENILRSSEWEPQIYMVPRYFTAGTSISASLQKMVSEFHIPDNSNEFIQINEIIRNIRKTDLFTYHVDNLIVDIVYELCRYLESDKDFNFIIENLSLCTTFEAMRNVLYEFERSRTHPSEDRIAKLRELQMGLDLMPVLWTHSGVFKKTTSSG